jgi:hypothetical protein
MTWNEITLDNHASLIVNGETLGSLEYVQKNSTLNINVSNGRCLELPHAVDVSEQESKPRVFIVVDRLGSTFMIFGGPIAYLLGRDISPLGEIKLFRDEIDQEYWKTEFVPRENRLIIIYEAGVLVLDDNLSVRSHQPKLFNDLFQGMDGNAIRFIRDHEQEWLMMLDERSA